MNEKPAPKTPDECPSCRKPASRVREWWSFNEGPWLCGPCYGPTVFDGMVA